MRYWKLEEDKWAWAARMLEGRNITREEEIWVTDRENKENCMLQHLYKFLQDLNHPKGYLAGESFSATKTPSFWDPKV